MTANDFSLAISDGLPLVIKLVSQGRRGKNIPHLDQKTKRADIATSRPRNTGQVLMNRNRIIGHMGRVPRTGTVGARPVATGTTGGWLFRHAQRGGSGLISSKNSRQLNKNLVYYRLSGVV